MARILITGSADGLGQLSARARADQGHQIVLYARNSERGRYAKQKVPIEMEFALKATFEVVQTKTASFFFRETAR